ncbi:MAG TPA: PaaI family thioesterase [Candidatus Yaniella excrementigallinarum]|nr:PaaI family thioesterase [Candidatus Yaniella excrementigallinarum]
MYNSANVSEEITQKIHDSFAAQGLMKSLGARLGRIESGKVHIHLPMSDAVTQQHGYFHAGATSAIVDSAGGYAGLTKFNADSEVLTVEYKINLISPGIGDELEAIGTVIKPGSTLTVCKLEVFAHADGQQKLIAHGQQTLIQIRS